MLFSILNLLADIRMKNIILFLLLALSLGAPVATQAKEQLTPNEIQPQAALLSARVLTHYQYQHLPLDDELSVKIFDGYLKSLDSNKMFFLQDDIDRFASARKQLDDAILHRDLQVPFAIYNRYLQRVEERFKYARSLLKKGFDFGKQESFRLSRKDAAWAQSTTALNELWRKRVKNDWLELQLAGKKRNEIVDTLNKRYANIMKSVSNVNSNDVFQGFMNAYTMAIDPHTNYFGLQTAENFDIAMKLSLTGIGAALVTEGEYTTIKELLAGGPAALSGKFKGGDRITGVGQGKDGPITDVVGWRINDVVDLIRGPKDTVVRLEILPAGMSVDSHHQVISLVRKKITLQKQAARKSIIEVKKDGISRRIGVITLPSFYEDFAAHSRGNKDYKSASRDVARLLKELKKEKVDGIVMDLRDNGGGSLGEAIRLTGLFIDTGPVVQERDTTGKIHVSRDSDEGALWNGPLGVLINRSSASASEIFTAAIQDYDRGIVMGSTSFGKGTVQTVLNLDKIAKSDKPQLGELKLTIAQFFRINGGSTQLRGVTPDIKFPTATDTADFGESSFTDALPWSKIQAADYQRVGNLHSILPELRARHEQRISHDPDFKYLREDIAHINALRKKNEVSLNEAERRKERDAQEARKKAREKADADNKSNKESAKAGEQDDNDIFLDEAAHIVSDEAILLEQDRTFASSNSL